MSLPFLDVFVQRSKDEFICSTYHKPTFTGLYTNYFSFVPHLYKTGLISCLLHRAHSIASSFAMATQEFARIKQTLAKNAYPIQLLDKCTRKFIQNQSPLSKPVIQTVSKLDLYLCIPFLGQSSIMLKKKVTSLVSKMYPQVNLRIVLKPTMCLGNLFGTKD